MNIREFGECLEYNIEHNLKHAILGLGAPGVGKSQLIRQIGQKYGYKVIDIRLAQMSEVEIGGLIYPNQDRTKTIWLSPEVLPDEKRDGPKTILLLDEITSCTKRVQVAAYQLILDRRIGQYTLPEGCFVVALGNREDDDGVYIQLAGPLADRFEIHYIEPDFNSWKYEYALKYNVHPYVVQYLSTKPADLHNQQAGDGNMVFATPRSWDRVSDILHFDCDIEKKVIQHKIIGNVGEKVGTQFIQYCLKHARYVSVDDFLAGKREVPDKPEQLNLLVDAIVNKVHFIEKVQNSTFLEKQQRQELDQALRGLFRIPQAEFTIIGLTRLLAMNRAIVKEALCELDDNKVLEFIKANKNVLGLSDTETAGMVSGSSKAQFLKLWEK